jgi:hypothetical protein
MDQNPDLQGLILISDHLHLLMVTHSINLGSQTIRRINHHGIYNKISTDHLHIKAINHLMHLPINRIRIIKFILSLKIDLLVLVMVLLIKVLLIKVLLIKVILIKADLLISLLILINLHHSISHPCLLINQDHPHLSQPPQRHLRIHRNQLTQWLMLLMIWEQEFYW